MWAWAEPVLAQLRWLGRVQPNANSKKKDIVTLLVHPTRLSQARPISAQSGWLGRVQPNIQ